MAEEEKPKKPGPGKTEFAKLIEVMESNNKSTAKIEIDGRNTRRHLLEMKNMQKVMTDLQQRTLFGFQNFQDMIDGQSLQGLENNLEQKSIFQDIRESLKNIERNTAMSSVGGKGGGGFGRGALLGGIGGALIGAGAGIAALGIAIPAFFGGLQAGEYGLEALNADFKFDNIKRAAIGFSDIITSIPKEGLIALAGLMGIAAFGGIKGNATGTALGFSLLGAAIPGFFGGFALGDSLLGAGANAGYLDLDFPAVKKAVQGFASVISGFPMDMDGAKIAGILAIGVGLGATKGVTGALGVAAGMTAIGAGISGFFAGFALGDFAISQMNVDYKAVKESIVAFGETINLLDGEAEAKLVALLTGTGLVATLTKFGTQAKITAGMSLVGAAIGGFFTGFSALTSLGGALGVNGKNTKDLLTNFGEGMQALDEKTFAGIAAMMGVAGIAALFGPVGAGVTALGGGILAILGASIAGFILAFATVTKIGSVLGVNGSSSKMLMTNIADGINALGNLNVNGLEMMSLGVGLGALATGIVAFLTLEGVGGIGSRLLGGVTNAMDLVSSGFGLFGTNEKGQSIFEKIAEDVQPLIKLNNSKGMEEFNDLAENIVSLSLLDSSGLDSTAKAFERFGDSVMNTAEQVNFALNGGTMGQLAFSGMTNDIENATVGLERLRDSLDMSTDGFTMSASSPMVGLSVGNMSVENALLKMADASPSNNTNVVQKGGDNVKGGDTVILNQSHNPVTSSLHHPR